MSIGSCYATAGAVVALVGGSLGFASGTHRHSTRHGDTVVASPCDTAAHDAASALCAARAFLATLNDSQRLAIVVPLTAASARRWSNLPYSLARRNGLLLRSLDGEQRDAAMRLASAAMSASGMATFRSIRKADALLARQPDRLTEGGAPNGGPPSIAAAAPPRMPNDLKYGEYNYAVAFVGEPSDSAPWMLQFGGHHLGVNITYHGNTSIVSTTPDFVGVEPQHFVIDGVDYAPLDRRKNAMYAILHALNDDQKLASRLGATFDDVLVGPGRDGQFPTPEGVLVGRLKPSQRVLVRRAIEAWLRDAPDSLAHALIRDYTSDSAFSNTRVAWSGATQPTIIGSYVRIDGPRVWIEFVCQAGIVFSSQIHFHTIWRDKSRDYGGSFTFDPGSS